MSSAEPAMKSGPKWVFTFGAGQADGSAGDRNLLGGKGAYLAEMSPRPSRSARLHHLGRSLQGLSASAARSCPTSSSRWSTGRSTRWRARSPARNPATSTTLCSCRSGLAAAPPCPA